MAELTLTLLNIEQVPFSIEPVDKYGKPAEVENVEWVLSDPSLGSLVISEDTKSCTFITSGSIGECQVSVSADPTIGEPVGIPLLDIAYVKIVPSEAVGLGIKAGTPTLKE